MEKEKTSFKLLNLLKDGKFYSGEQLGASLNLTRSAIWKAIKELQSYGLPIESIGGKGYRVLGGFTPLDREKILNELSSDNQSRLDELTLLNQVGSTNDYLLEKAKESQSKTIACFAEQQTQGKGRRGRPWISPYGNNIYHSLLFHLNNDPAELMGLSLAIGVAVLLALKRYGAGDDIGLKWPNDILWSGKKLCGILIEMLAESHQHVSVVVGIGINTHTFTESLETIDQPYVALDEILGKSIDRNKLAGLVLNETLNAIDLFRKEKLKPFIEHWKRYDQLYKKPVTVHTQQGEIHGIMHGISENGDLLICDNQNNISRFMSGEISLRSAC